MTVQKTLGRLLEEVNGNLNYLIREKSQRGNLSVILLHTLKGALYTGEDASLQDVLCSATVGWALANATGEALTVWGSLLECHRWPGESDASYRDRVFKQPDSMDKLVALIAKFTVMSTDGLKDIVMRKDPLTGKNTIFVMPDGPFLSNDILANIRESVGEVLGPDSNIEVSFPTLKRIDLVIKLEFSPQIKFGGQKAARTAAKKLVHNYLAGKYIGDSLLLEDIFNIITTNIPLVVDIPYFSVVADGVELASGDCHCSYSEILYINNIEVL